MQIEYVSAAYERFGKWREKACNRIHRDISDRALSHLPFSRRGGGLSFSLSFLFSLNFNPCAPRKRGAFCVRRLILSRRYVTLANTLRLRRKESSRNYSSDADVTERRRKEGKGAQSRRGFSLHAAESLWRTSGIVNRPR